MRREHTDREYAHERATLREQVLLMGARIEEMIQKSVQALEARDSELAQGRWRGPLHGSPIAVKDRCYTRDLPTEAGSRAMAGFLPGYDATIVRHLEDAGAVIVGKTVTHEFAYGVTVPPTMLSPKPQLAFIMISS